MDKLIFSPYDAGHLKDIIQERAEKGLCPGSYDDGIIRLCAAYGAKEHGDARRTIELLGKAADIADRNKEENISEMHVKLARELIEFEGISQVLKTLPHHEKAVVLAIAKDVKNKNKITYENHIDGIPTTGSIYDEYKNICYAIGSETLTQRRIRDYLDELESLGLIHIQVVYKGRRGRNAHIELQAPVNIIEKVITEDITFSGFKSKIVQEKLIPIST